MKKVMRSIACLVSAVMVIGFLGGCGSKETTEEKGSASTQSATENTANTPAEKNNYDNGVVKFPLKDRIKLTYAHYEDNQIDQNLSVFEELRKRTNIDVEFQPIPSANAAEKIKVMFASGDMPDITVWSTGNTKVDLAKYAANGIFANMKDYYEKGNMPNLKKLLEKQPNMKPYTFDDKGNIFGIAGCIDFKWVLETFLVREDILKKYGYTQLESFDDIYNFLSSVKKDNPKNFPWGSAWGAVHLLNPIAKMNQSGHGIYFNEKENKYKFGPLEENYKRAIEFLNKCYKDKLLDPEFPTKAWPQYNEDANNGKMVFTWMYMSHLNTLNKDIAKTLKNPENRWKALYPPKVNGEYGKLQIIEGYTNWYWTVSANCKNIPEAVAFLDYNMSDEITELCEWGVEGQTFTRNADGKREFVPTLDTATTNGTDKIYTKYGAGNQQTHIRRTFDFEAANGWGKDASEPMGDIATHPEMLAKIETPITFSEEDQKKHDQLMGAINTYLDESVLKFVFGAKPMSEWDDFVNKLKELKVEEVEAIYNKYVK